LQFPFEKNLNETVPVGVTVLLFEVTEAVSYTDVPSGTGVGSPTAAPPAALWIVVVVAVVAGATVNGSQTPDAPR